MKKLVLILFAAAISGALQPAADTDVARWEKQAQNVTIVRDTWGIAHVYGKTDADAVFGLMYAQAEDDFNRVETNFINAMGRLAEAEGEKEDVARPAHEAVHRPRRHEGEVRGEPAVAASADERVGRRVELSTCATHPEVTAARDHAIRAVDGADVQRGQHRRRHRAREPRRSSRRSTARRQRPVSAASRSAPRRQLRQASLTEIDDASSRPDRTASPSGHP